MTSINDTLNFYAKAYCQKNITAMMSLFDDSDNISVIGTGEDELCVGRDQVRELFLRNFNEATALKFEWDWIDTRVLDDHAVISVKLKIHLEYLGENLIVPIRWTVVVKKKNDCWVWVHRHASTAAASQKKDQAYPKS